MQTTHSTAAAALATKAQHFLVIANQFVAFANEDECWRVHQYENIITGSAETSRRAKYVSRRELAA